MAKLKYCVLHCTASPLTVLVTPDTVHRWHRGPRDIFNSEHKLLGVRYKGTTYLNRRDLPDEYVGGAPIASLQGRGWRQVGYSLLIDNFGKRHTLVEVDDDAEIDPWEITNGVKGINHEALHLVTAGGVGENGHPLDTRTEEQLKTQETVLFEILDKHPDILFAGHNQFANKACPSYNTVDYLRSICIPEKNIHKP